MINLMYLVFIGMLALNVSTEVLDGFELVEVSLLRSVKASTERNDRIFDDLENYYKANSEKAKEWYDKGVQVKTRTDSLFNYTQSLKNRIVIKSDGENGDPEKLKHPDDLNAAFEIMFEQGKNDGAKLKSGINDYREYIASLVNNPSVKNIIEKNLSTEPTPKAKENKQSWEESMFFQMPVAAAVTLLTKLQNDIRYAESEVLNELVKNIDIKDLRVNSVEAFVIPESKFVMRGSSYKANIVLAAQDTTQKPKIVINGKDLPPEANGLYVAGTGSTGAFSFKGYAEIAQGDGTPIHKEFSAEYVVMEPSATIAPVLMNVLYAGIENEIAIDASGVARQNITASMTNGSLTDKGNGIWAAKPTTIGTDAVITVNAKMSDGHSLEMGKRTLRVRPLPPPTAFLSINATGKPPKFNGGPLSKADLLNADAVEAAIDDGLLNIKFNVLKFEIRYTDQMGMTVREQSDGSRFSARQKEILRGFTRGRTVLISGISTRGPDGVEQVLKSPLEIIIN
jgi:gliding motility-associated protein GldM